MSRNIVSLLRQRVLDPLKVRFVERAEVADSAKRRHLLDECGKLLERLGGP